MDVVETCITDSIETISSPSRRRVDLTLTSGISENKESINSIETISDVTTNSNEGCITNKPSGGSSVNILSSFDDSFDVFLPVKKSSSQESASQQTGKQKQKKSTRTRSCPYFSTKSIKDHFKSPSKSKEDRDLELALKRSLLDIKGSDETSSTFSNEPVEFSFVVTKKDNPLKLKNWTSKKDLKKNVKSILTRRTCEDRQKIITQKVAIVLLECKEIKNNISGNEKIELTSSLLKSSLVEASTLWELSKKESAELGCFYVKELNNFIDQSLPSSTVCEMENQNEDTEILTSTQELYELIGH